IGTAGRTLALVDARTFRVTVPIEPVAGTPARRHGNPVLLLAGAVALAAILAAILWLTFRRQDGRLLAEQAELVHPSGGVLAQRSGTPFASLTRLGTDFNPTVGGCGGGSPRFSIQLASGKNVFVYLGPSPNFTGCTLNSWQSSGNLIGNNDTGRYDTSQVQA